MPNFVPWTVRSYVFLRIPGKPLNKWGLTDEQFLMGTMKLCIVKNVKNEGPVLLGRDWLNSIKVDWTNIFQVNSQRKENSTAATTERLQSILKKSTRRNSVKALEKSKAKLLKDDAKSVFKRHDWCLYLSNQKWRMNYIIWKGKESFQRSILVNGDTSCSICQIGW